jgi:glucose-1-phosphate adenylyltransferase
MPRSNASNALSIILAGGAGKRLFPLTQDRSKPAVPLGGKYRLIDVPISNCINSGLNKIFVLTQFNSASLNRHIAQTYRMDLFSHGFVEILAAEQTPGDFSWYQGTAETCNAVYVPYAPPTNGCTNSWSLLNGTTRVQVMLVTAAPPASNANSSR